MAGFKKGEPLFVLSTEKMRYGLNYRRAIKRAFERIGVDEDTTRFVLSTMLFGGGNAIALGLMLGGNTAAVEDIVESEFMWIFEQASLKLGPSLKHGYILTKQFKDALFTVLHEYGYSEVEEFTFQLHCDYPEINLFGLAYKVLTL